MKDEKSSWYRYKTKVDRAIIIVEGTRENHTSGFFITRLVRIIVILALDHIA